MLSPTEITPEAALRDLEHPDARVREQAAAALGAVGPADRDAAVAALRRALKDDRGAVRYAAALSLGELRDSGAFADLCDQLEDGDPMARQAAAIALGRIRDRRAFAPLAQALTDGPPEVRFQAVASLFELDPGRAFDLLLGALADTDAEVRGSAAAALGDHGDRRACDRLTAMLEDENHTCRFEAAYALARMGDRRASGTLVGLIRDREFALPALEGLTLLRDEEARAPLQSLMRRRFSAAVVKVRAAAALAALGDEDSRTFLRGRLRARREDVRGLVVQTLGEIGDEWATGLLRELHTSPDGESMREMIEDALARALRGDTR